jgi:hypothetical protein
MTLLRVLEPWIGTFLVFLRVNGYAEKLNKPQLAYITGS